MKGWTADAVAKLGKAKPSSPYQENDRRACCDFAIGIDPGVNTGIAIWNCKYKQFNLIGSLMIHEVMELVVIHNKDPFTVLVRFEDAMKRKWFGKSDREQLQGAGSIKRDCRIWQDFLTYHSIPFEAVAPKNNITKLSSASFKKITGWTGRTNEHGRDAAMLVVNY